MTHHRIAVATLAALFGLGATGSALVSGASRAPAVAHDDHGDRHDNGRHAGRFKHHDNDEDENRDRDDNRGGLRANRVLRGTILSVGGATLTLRLNDGRILSVNDQNALNAGLAPNLFIGEMVTLRGAFDRNGVFFANRITGG